jgi:hypothetical protein
MIQMPVELDADADQQVRFLFENIVLRMIATDKAHESLRFKYISPEWVGNPGWYFWPRGRSGVFLLRLDSAKQEGYVLYSQWQIFYYPSPDEVLFESYTLDEQIVRLSDLFDKAPPGCECRCECSEADHAAKPAEFPSGIGVPRPEVRERFNSWLFWVGDRDWVWQDGSLRSCMVAAPRISRTWTCCDRWATQEDGEKVLLREAGALDRNLPAWRICQEFVGDFLNGLREIGILHVPLGEGVMDMDGIYRRQIYGITETDGEV